MPVLINLNDIKCVYYDSQSEGNVIEFISEGSQSTALLVKESVEEINNMIDKEIQFYAKLK